MPPIKRATPKGLDYKNFIGGNIRGQTMGFFFELGSPSPKCKARSLIALVRDLTVMGSP